MLPRATNERTRREAAQGRQSGRSLEIQRLIGRSLRAITKMNEMGEFTITIDCDVIQADGGTRTASISGGYVALWQCFGHMRRAGLIETIPIREEVAAVSCGLYKGAALLDLDYAEDSAAEADTNFVLTASGGIVEIQGTAEAEPFSEQSFRDLLTLAQSGIKHITKIQRQACSE
jgi:ribonuclease PH